MFSQLIDTAMVLLLLCVTGAIEWNRFGGLLANGYLFKVLVAASDTPFFYAAVFLWRRTFAAEIREAQAGDPTAA
jgi:hypothetical protein